MQGGRAGRPAGCRRRDGFRGGNGRELVAAAASPHPQRAPAAALQASTAKEQLGAHQRYQISAAEQLKGEGNRLHGAKQFWEAAEKYERALTNLEGACGGCAGCGGAGRRLSMQNGRLELSPPPPPRLPRLTLLLPPPLAGQTSSAAAALRTSCQSNLASCFLQLQQWQQCAAMCDTVLAVDASNRKALYRRGTRLYSRAGLAAGAQCRPSSVPCAHSSAADTPPRRRLVLPWQARRCARWSATTRLWKTCAERYSCRLRLRRG